MFRSGEKLQISIKKGGQVNLEEGGALYKMDFSELYIIV